MKIFATTKRAASFLLFQHLPLASRINNSMKINYSNNLPDNIHLTFDMSIEALLSEHYCAPVTGDKVSSPEEAFCWFQNYAFMQGFALISTAQSQDHFQVSCIYHGKKT